MAPPGPKLPYNKPALSPPDLLQHLISRGLIITRRLRALHALEHIGYYRLLLYMRPLQQFDPATGTRRFVPGTTFDDVVALYEFDGKLRILCMDAVERIEVALRAAIVSEVAVSHGPHFFTDQAHFDTQVAFDDFQDVVKEEKRSVAFRHYYRRYSTPSLPPIWVVMEALTFGTLSHFFSGLQRSHRKAIAARFGFDEKVLRSWLRALNGLRNMAAHHNRLWNAPMHVDQPIAAKRLAVEFGPTNDTFFARAVVAVALLENIAPRSRWKERLIRLLDKNPGVPEQAMGFPPGWRKRSFWS